LRCRARKLVPAGLFTTCRLSAERMGNRRNLSREEKAGNLRPMRPVPLIWCNSPPIANEIAGQVSSAAISCSVSTVRQLRAVVSTFSVRPMSSASLDRPIPFGVCR